MLPFDSGGTLVVTRASPIRRWRAAVLVVGALVGRGVRGGVPAFADVVRGRLRLLLSGPAGSRRATDARRPHTRARGLEPHPPDRRGHRDRGRTRARRWRGVPYRHRQCARRPADLLDDRRATRSSSFSPPRDSPRGKLRFRQLRTPRRPGVAPRLRQHTQRGVHRALYHPGGHPTASRRWAELHDPPGRYARPQTTRYRLAPSRAAGR
jgi:hypothetical protein